MKKWKISLKSTPSLTITLRRCSRQSARCSFRVLQMSLSMLARRSEVLAFVQDTLACLLLPADDLFFAAQVLDCVGLWLESDMRVQVVSALVALYMCIKLRGNPREPVDSDRLFELTERANQFFEHSRDGRKVVREDVIQQEMDLLDSLHFLMPTFHVATWVEFFFLRTDVLTRESQTPLLRFVADVAKDLSRSLVCQVNISEENSASAIAFNAWCLACVLSRSMTAVYDACFSMDVTSYGSHRRVPSLTIQ